MLDSEVRVDVAPATEVVSPDFDGQRVQIVKLECKLAEAKRDQVRLEADVNAWKTKAIGYENHYDRSQETLKCIRTQWNIQDKKSMVLVSLLTLLLVACVALVAMGPILAHRWHWIHADMAIAWMLIGGFGGLGCITGIGFTLAKD